MGPQTAFQFAQSISLPNHPLWSALKPYLRNYPGRHNRFEVSPSIPPGLLAQALGLKVDCAHCGKKIHPFRVRHASPQRDTRGTAKQVYVSVACPLDRNFGCARGKRARDASEDLAIALTLSD